MAISSSQNTIKNQFDMMPGSFFLTDEKETIVYTSKGIEDSTGYSTAEVIGKRPGDLWGGYMDRLYYTGMWSVLESGNPFVGQVYNRRKDGSAHQENIHVSVIHGEQNYYVAFNPIFEEERDQRVFSGEFLSVSSKEDKFKRWLKEKIGLQRDIDVSLHEYFFAHLVSPTQQQYSARMADMQLVLEAQQNPDVFKQLYEKYEKSVFNYFLHRLSGQATVAADLTQETFFRALRYLSHFRPSNASYFTYLQRIAHNLLVNHYRRKEVQPLDEVNQLIDETDHDELIDSVMRKEDLWKKAESLSSIEQDILEMKYRDDMSILEIAMVLQKTENAVKLYLSRSRKKLKDVLGG
ncbi:MAG: sigma-70 family RNA polymerase sigma factor [Candidatus Magasanikbacteria bacterium]